MSGYHKITPTSVPNIGLGRKRDLRQTAVQSSCIGAPSRNRDCVLPCAAREVTA
jgi:hypothetical protein